MKNIAIIGTVGIPANCGGFETLAENLVKYHDKVSLPDSLTVYCSGKSYPARESSFLSAHLKNVAASIPRTSKNIIFRSAPYIVRLATKVEIGIAHSWRPCAEPRGKVSVPS